MPVSKTTILCQNYFSFRRQRFHSLPIQLNLFLLYNGRFLILFRLLIYNLYYEKECESSQGKVATHNYKVSIELQVNIYMSEYIGDKK